MPHNMVTGIFGNRTSAENATDALVDSGFSPNDLSILMSIQTRDREFSAQAEARAPEGIASGAATGGVLGALVGGLAAISAVALPGIGLLAAGPIIAILTGAGMGAATGGLIGSQPKEHAKVWLEEVERGSIIVGAKVHDDVEAERARRVFEKADAKRIVDGTLKTEATETSLKETDE